MQRVGAPKRGQRPIYSGQSGLRAEYGAGILLTDVFQHADISLLNSLASKSQMAAVGRDVEAGIWENGVVPESEGDRKGEPNEPLAVPADFPEHAIQVWLTLKEVNLVLRTASVPQDPAMKNLPRRCLQVR